MLRDYRYKPKPITHICPVCGREVSNNEWYDYGMHLVCCGVPDNKESSELQNFNEAEFVAFNRQLSYIKTNV
ncbi:MAG: hypothetical protein PF436_01245 [Prolixibacteraceae bacterium]|jgi:hypothetical protein|nr:hypothetical protein [Prolixibacteraceae bacterium]